MQTKVNTSAEALGNTGNGGSATYIAKSGIYDVSIQFANVEVTKNGAEQLNLSLIWNDNEPQTIWGPIVTGTDGKPTYGMELVQQLNTIAGLTDGDEITLEEATVTVGKDKKEKDVTIIAEYTDLAIKIQLQEEYSINPNTKQISKRMVIKNVFREDGASAKEIVNGTEVGKSLAFVTEKYATNVTYKDGLTPEDVQAWKDSKKDGNGGGSAAPAPKASTGGKKKLFTA